MSGGHAVEIGSFSSIPEVVPSNFVNWRRYYLNLCYSAEQNVHHRLSLYLTVASDAKRRKKHHLYSIHKCVPYQILFLSLQNKSIVWNIQKPQTLQRCALTGSIFYGNVKGIESVPNSQTAWVLDY